MSDSGGLFDGNSNLSSLYNYGTFTANPTANTPDFYRQFPVVAKDILFITGDGLYWGLTDYNTLYSLVTAQQGISDPNITFQAGINGVESTTTGNVLSRSFLEDPWVGLSGSHDDNIFNETILWGEADFGLTREYLKNAHGGINVYINDQSPVPEPATLFLTGAGLASLLGYRRRNRTPNVE
jgi:hypothetical protein